MTQQRSILYGQYKEGVQTGEGAEYLSNVVREYHMFGYRETGYHGLIVSEITGGVLPKEI